MGASRLCALCCALSIATPAVALAEPVAPAEAPKDDSLAKAEALYLEGRTSFETADYTRAIELWTEAYGIVSDEPENATIKAALIYNIAAAQEKAYDIDTDLAHLRRANVLLQTYAASIPALYGDTPEANAELAKVNERIDELRLRIEEAEAALPKDDKDEGDDTQPPPEVVPPIEAPSSKPSKPFIIAGAVTAGVGLAGLGVMAAGLAMGGGANDIDDLAPDDIDGRRDRFDRGRLGNTLAIVGGAAGGALLVSGAVLLGIGLKRRSDSTVAFTPLSPWVSRRGAGVRLGGRF